MLASPAKDKASIVNGISAESRKEPRRELQCGGAVSYARNLQKKSHPTSEYLLVRGFVNSIASQLDFFPPDAILTRKKKGQDAGCLAAQRGSGLFRVSIQTRDP